MARVNPFARRRAPGGFSPDIARFLFGGNVTPGLARRNPFGGALGGARGVAPAPAAPASPPVAPLFSNQGQWEDFYGQQYGSVNPWSSAAAPVPLAPAAQPLPEQPLGGLALTGGRRGIPLGGNMPGAGLAGIATALQRRRLGGF